MAIKVIAQRREVKLGKNPGMKFVMRPDLYIPIQEKKVFAEASTHSGISAGVIKAAWDAAGEVLKTWATEGHSIPLPGLGTMRFGVRSKAVEKLEDVRTNLITVRRIIFRGYIDETEVAMLKTGMDMELHLGSMQEITIPAKLSYIAPEGEMQNGAKMFEVKADATIPDSVTIRSGYSANATIVLGTLNDVLACDEKAISFEAGKPYVYVLTSSPDDTEHQQFERREVTIGISDGLSVELKSGVKKGEWLRGNEIKEQVKGTGFVIARRMYRLRHSPQQ